MILPHTKKVSLICLNISPDLSHTLQNCTLAANKSFIAFVPALETMAGRSSLSTRRALAPCSRTDRHFEREKRHRIRRRTSDVVVAVEAVDVIVVVVAAAADKGGPVAADASAFLTGRPENGCDGTLQ